MREIPLTQGCVALVDDEDYDLVSQFRWEAKAPSGKNWSFYARRRNPHMFMHRFIVDAPRGLHVDHIDGDGLNNQRSNLRLCGSRENQANRGLPRNNRSGFKGVSKHRNGWQVNIQNRYVGKFDSPEEAARAYDKAAIQLYGEFARLNFPEGDSM